MAFFGVYLRKMRTHSPRNLYMDVHRSFVCNIKSWKRHQCPSVGEQKVKCGTSMPWNTAAMTTWMSLKGIMHSGEGAPISQGTIAFTENSIKGLPWWSSG